MRVCKSFRLKMGLFVRSQIKNAGLQIVPKKKVVAMARPKKQGLDYFPLDVVLDDKFDLIEAEFGIKGFGVLIKLYQKIYAENGYYCEWNSEVALVFTRKNCPDVGASAVSEIVKSAIKRDIFDKDMFDKYGVLTSRGIQTRFIEATSRRSGAAIDEKYSLIINADNNRINVYNNSINVCNNPQSKVKESKVNNNNNGGGNINILKTKTTATANAYSVYCQNINALPTKTEIDELNYWLDDVGVEESMLCRIIEDSAMANKRNMAYIKAILNSKVNDGIKTLAAYENAQKIWENKKKNGKVNAEKASRFNYADQREIDDNNISDRQKQLMMEMLNID